MARRDYLLPLPASRTSAECARGHAEAITSFNTLWDDHAALLTALEKPYRFVQSAKIAALGGSAL